MNLKQLKEIKENFPRISKIGYEFLKQYWKLKTLNTDFQYPKKDGVPSISKQAVREFNKKRLFGPKKRICYAVFNNLHFNMNGDVFSCSFNADMFLGNINTNTIKEIWEGATIKDFQNTMSNYNLDKCLSCKEVLDAQNYSSFPGLKYDFNSSDNAIMPTQMSFEMSDLCNFACIMCSEDFSSSIKKLKNIPIQKNQYPDSFIDQLDEFIPHLKIATFIGGEPLMIKAHYKIWKKIIEINPNCNIHIQTNGSILNDEFLQLIEKGNFDIGISIDSINKENFEKIRLFSNFDLVMHNIKKLLVYKLNRKIGLNFNFCPLIMNWHEIPKIIEFANNCGVSLKILHVLSPYNLVIINKKPEYILNVYKYLSNIKIEESSSIIHKVNGSVFSDFLKNLLYYYENAIKREDYISNISLHSIDDIYALLRNEIFEHIRFKVFSEKEKLELLKKTRNILVLQSIENQKYVTSYMLFLLAESRTNQEINDAKSIHTKTNKFIKVIEELILLEKNL
jgi:radical SAM protein with 4Fe4S-binding SPASM domain